MRWTALAGSIAGLAVALAALSRADGPATPMRARFGAWGIDLSARDLDVRPGDDFAAHAWGNWYGDATIADHRANIGVHSALIDSTDARVRTLILDSAQDPKTPTAQKIGDLYNAFMDEARVEELDDKPLQKDVAVIRSLSTKDAMAEWMGAANGSFGMGFFSARVLPDKKRPSRNVLRLSQNGLGLPRDYYLTDPFEAHKAAYEEYAARTLNMLGWHDAERAAREIVAMETRIATASWPLTDRRDMTKTYNPMSRASLEAMAQGFPWEAYFRGAGLGTIDSVIVAEHSAVPDISDIYAQTPLPTLAAWAAFQTADRASPYLSQRFAANRFAFRDKVLRGVEAQMPRWQRGVILFDDHLEDAVGREYVARNFSQQSKEAMERLVLHVKQAMGERIQGLAWMTPPTRAAAMNKLSKLQVMVGYPTQWRDYSNLEIDRRDLYGSVQRTKAFDWAYARSKLAKPVDRQEWLMPAHAADAYADYVRVALAFGAAYLQPPYFDSDADMAVNYGAIGGIIGHELTHQFDDQGRKFDADGFLRDWWTAEDAARFEREADRLVRQYATYEIAPGMLVDGRQTLGENIADVGGLLVALDAYHIALNGRPAPILDGLTGDQRVFLGWAQIWRNKEREESLREHALSDVHSPARYRVIGPARNVDAWYDAFAVAPTDRYYLSPEERVRIW